MLADGQLFVSYLGPLGRPDEALPRLGIWRANGNQTPEEIELSAQARSWLRAMGLPEGLREKGATTEQHEAVVRASALSPVTRRTDELARMLSTSAHDSVSASTVSRAKDALLDTCRDAGHAIDTLVQPGPERGTWTLSGLPSDVGLLLSAMHDARRDEARALVGAVGTLHWDGLAAPLDVDAVRISSAITEPTARAMLEQALAELAPADRSWPKARLIGATAVVGAIGSIVVAIAVGGGSDPDSKRARSALPDDRQRAVLEVDNRTTYGERFAEDDQPTSLVRRPLPSCCPIPGTERQTGDRYDAAVCQINSKQFVTNGNLSDHADDDNPHLDSSHRFYGVRLRDGTFGFVSEIWIRKRQRGGLGLPRCTPADERDAQ